MLEDGTPVFMHWQNYYKMAISPRGIHRFNAIPIKSPMAFFTELEKPILKFTWKHKMPGVAKAVFRKKNQTWRLDNTRFQFILQNHSNKNIMVLLQKQAHRVTYGGLHLWSQQSGRSRQEDCKFGPSLGNSVRPCLKIKIQRTENVAQYNGPKFNLQYRRRKNRPME